MIHTVQIFPPQPFGKKKKANKCCYRLRSCAIKPTINKTIKFFKKRQNLGRTTKHSRPMAVNTTKDLGHINWSGQHFCLDMSCRQLNCSKESNKVLKEKNPIRKVKELIKRHQVWRQSEYTYMVAGRKPHHHPATCTLAHRATGPSTRMHKDSWHDVQPRPTWRNLRSGGPQWLGCSAPMVRGKHSTTSAGYQAVTRSRIGDTCSVRLRLWELSVWAAAKVC